MGQIAGADTWVRLLHQRSDWGQITRVRYDHEVRLGQIEGVRLPGQIAGADTWVRLLGQRSDFWGQIAGSD